MIYDAPFAKMFSDSWARWRGEAAISAGSLLGADGAEQVLAHLLAAQTGFGAEAAVLHGHRLGVPLALLGALPAGKRARLERGACQLRLEACLAGEHVAGRLAEVGAVKVQPAPDQAPSRSSRRRGWGIGSRAPTRRVGSRPRSPMDSPWIAHG